MFGVSYADALEVVVFYGSIFEFSLDAVYSRSLLGNGEFVLHAGSAVAIYIDIYTRRVF